jgi:hypothetical protein
MAEGVIGQRVRCIACQEHFLADPNVKPPPPPPRRPPAAPPGVGDDELAPDGRPFCPGCGRRVNWDWIVCYHCGEQFDFDPDPRRRERGFYKRPRRDCISHRGALLANLGNITLGVGALSLCLLGVGAVVTVPLGISTIVMASGDLNLMRSGQMDPAGKAQTENGRNAAVIGLALSLIFAAAWIMLYLSQH